MSTDVAVIKQARQVAKGKVTRSINSLDLALVQDTSGKFILSEINEKRLDDIYGTLLSSYETFQEIHDRHFEYDCPQDDEQMAKFIEDESVYAKNVAKAVSTVDRKYAKFLAAKSKVENETKLTTLQNEKFCGTKKADDKIAEDSAKETKIALQADTLESFSFQNYKSSFSFQNYILKNGLRENIFNFPAEADNTILKAKVDEVITHEDSANYCQDIPEHDDSANYCQDIPEQPIDDPAFKEVITNVSDKIVKFEKTQECTNDDQDIPKLSTNVSKKPSVMAAYEYQNISEKVSDQITGANEDMNASVNVNIAILNANAKDTKAIAYVKVANAKIVEIIDANEDSADAKVFGFDRNIINGQEFIESNFPKPIIDDELEGKLNMTDVAEFKKNVPEENVANQLKISVGRSKLTNRRINLQKMISFVVHVIGCITCYSVNMLRWAGRASLVIMNQEENSLNTDTGSWSSYYVVLDTALGGAKLLYKFTLLAKQVKAVQKSVNRVLGDTKLTLNEMFTLVAEIGNLLNERPIGTKPNEHSGTDYLSPNSLLLGRCSGRISSGPFQEGGVFTDDPKAAHSRSLLVQAITTQFWKIWIANYFPTLLIRQKWHVDRRNMAVGDICLLKDPNAYRGEWRLCEVASVSPDDRGKVRNVRVMVKPRQGGSVHYLPTKPFYVNRHVSNLILLLPAQERGNFDERIPVSDGMKRHGTDVDASVTMWLMENYIYRASLKFGKYRAFKIWGLTLSQLVVKIFGASWLLGGSVNPRTRGFQNATGQNCAPLTA